MSRTYRTHLEWKTRALGCYWTYEEERKFRKENDLLWYVRIGWNGHYYLDRRCRDRKPWGKPPRWFKAMNRRIERAQAKAALDADKDLPVVKNSDRYEWT